MTRDEARIEWLGKMTTGGFPAFSPSRAFNDGWDAATAALRDQLDDPQYMYAGSRIHRTAIEGRNTEITELLGRERALRAQVAAAQKQAAHWEAVARTGYRRYPATG